MRTEANSHKLLIIHKDDNVLTVVNQIQPGDKDVAGTQEIVFTQRIRIGHRVAARAHIHLHNLKSDYIDTYTLDKDRTDVK